MARAAVLTLAGVLLAAASAAGQQPADVALQDVTVIDPAAGALPHRTILVRGSRITRMGPAADITIPRGARRIDGRGRYAIPGLWDMHFHMTGWQATAPELLVAYGITGIREMGGDWPMLSALRDSVAAGLRPGPRMILAGPLVDGPKPGVAWRYTVRSAADGTVAVDSLARLGVDFVKVHNGVPRDAYLALMVAARGRGMVVAGHVPSTVTPSEASDAGQRSLEHIATIFEGRFSTAHPDVREQLSAGAAFVASGADTLADRLARNRTWFDPTLYYYLLRIHRGETPADVQPLLRFVSAATGDWWSTFGTSPNDTMPAVIDARRRFYEDGARMTGVFARRGVGILAGTDVSGPGLIPGYSLHCELQLLHHDAGLSARAALVAATLEPARYFAADSLGSIAAGKVADIVLLEANPLEDIANTTRIAGVLLRGRWFGRPDLDRLLSQAAARAGRRP
jgi:imidazolonepropionase-like amidohydrolase